MTDEDARIWREETGTPEFKTHGGARKGAVIMTEPKKRGAKPGHPSYRHADYPERVSVKMTSEMKAAILERGDLSEFIRRAIRDRLERD